MMDAKRAISAVAAVVGISALVGCSAADAPMMGAPKSAPAYEPPPAASYAADAPAPMPAGKASAPQQPGRWGEGDARRAEKPMDDEAPRKDRPGLGTEWGETRHSSISRVSFERADAGSPFATLALLYNDRAGANALGSLHRAWTPMFPIASGLVSVELRGEGGRPLGGFISAGRSTVIGEAGQRYAIVLRNHTSSRFEVVLSVDGLDVMDGKSASFDKRGYILDAHGELEVDGFRQSTETVAAFRFGAVRNSYAEQKHGDSRNVGVIGVALFHERGVPQPIWSAEEIRRRRSANPFPGTFATPPGE